MPALDAPESDRAASVVSITAQGDLRTLVRQAYQEYAIIATARAQKLEEVRSALSHNRLRNAFVHRLLSGNEHSKAEERTVNLCAFWSEPGVRDDVESRRSLVHDAFKIWKGEPAGSPSLAQELREFFEEMPQRFAFQLSDKGNRAKKELFDNDNGAAATIDRFIARGAEILGTGQGRDKALNEFVKAVDRLSRHLTEMAHQPGNNEWFGGYLEPIAIDDL